MSSKALFWAGVCYFTRGKYKIKASYYRISKQHYILRFPSSTALGVMGKVKCCHEIGINVYKIICQKYTIKP